MNRHFVNERENGGSRESENRNLANISAKTVEIGVFGLVALYDELMALVLARPFHCLRCRAVQSDKFTIALLLHLCVGARLA